jgi:hypothetical protein
MDDFGRNPRPGPVNVLRAIEIQSLRERLAAGLAVDDLVFDRLFPHALRWRSASFWTPISVAVRAVELLVPNSNMRVLDVGSGVGKLCLIGAVMTNALFVGVEQRAHLVHAANDAAASLGSSNARFFHRTVETVDIETFDAIYFFNPFEENLWPASARFDETVELTSARFVRDVLAARALLVRARPGTRVVTYHGIGCPLPEDYDLVHYEHIRSGSLELWVKSDRE